MTDDLNTLRAQHATQSARVARLMLRAEQLSSVATRASEQAQTALDRVTDATNVLDAMAADIDEAEKSAAVPVPKKPARNRKAAK